MVKVSKGDMILLKLFNTPCSDDCETCILGLSGICSDMVSHLNRLGLTENGRQIVDDSMIEVI